MQNPSTWHKMAQNLDLTSDFGALIPMGHLHGQLLEQLLKVMPLVRCPDGSWAYFQSFSIEVQSILSAALQAS